MKIPLHGNKRSVSDVERYAHWASAMEANPKGFQTPPSSPHNPGTHLKGATTRLEKLARKAFK